MRDIRINVRLDDDTADQLDHCADAIGATNSTIAHMLIRWYLGYADAPPPGPTSKAASKTSASKEDTANV
jgi:hypothetical protein